MNKEIIFIITAFFLIVAVAIITLVLLYQKKQLQYLREKDQLKVSFEKEILESRLEIQEQTMKHISQEIHDNIGQVLSLVKLNINSMNCSEPKALQEKINNSSKLVGKAIQDLRDLSRSLHTDIITELGLVRSIESEFELIKKAGDYETLLTEEGEPYKLPHQHELILFRIFQEVLNNIIKHSGATRVMVNVYYNADNFSMMIADNGKGFDTGNFENSSNGLGIRNMQNRARIIGADYQIESDLGNGTRVSVILPVKFNAS